MTRKQRHLLTRIIVAAVLFLAGSLLHLPELAEMAVFLVCYVVVGWDIVWKAITNILHGQVFDENFLMTIATIGALILGEHSEGVAVMLFYQVGEWFQSYAVSKSRKSIASLMDIRPDYANIERDGKLVQVDPDEVQIGETIVVKPGERIPLDGTILKGFSTLDTSALTGESMPREVEPGMEVISGCINQTGILNIQTTKEFGESTVAKILDLVENASDKKGRIENFITRFARYYTPVVVFAALALAILPPLITQQPFSTWIYRALTFLVISCPCALVISIPLSFFGGIGGASKIGVLVKGSNYLEALANTEVVVFDKTGTLTKGSFAVSEIHPVGMEEAQLLELAAYAEDYSNHPISLSIKNAYGEKIDNSRVSDVQEIAGHGVQAVIDGKTILAGNTKLMEKEHIKYTPSSAVGTVVYLACDGKYAGCIVIEDEINPAHSCQLPVSCVATLSAICAYSSALVGIVFCPPFSFGVKRWGGRSPPHPCGYVVYWPKSGYSSSSANFSSVIAQSFVRALSVNSLSSVSSGESSPRISRRLSISPVRLPVL